MSVPSIRNNLMIMTLCWLTCAFDFYLVNFYVKYFPGNIYLNQLTKVVSELAGFICAGLLFERLGVQKSLAFAFLVSLIGGISILIFSTATGFYKNNSVTNAQWLFPALVIFTMFGVSAGYSIVYMSNA